LDGECGDNLCEEELSIEYLLVMELVLGDALDTSISGYQVAFFVDEGL
jgi:hypothetical protein